MRRQGSNEKAMVDIRRVALMKSGTSRQPPQHPSFQERGDRKLEQRTKEAAIRLPWGVVYGRIALASAGADLLIKKRRTVNRSRF